MCESAYEHSKYQPSFAIWFSLASGTMMFRSTVTMPALPEDTHSEHAL